MSTLNLKDLGEDKVKRIKRFATLFLIVVAGTFFTHAFLVGSPEPVQGPETVTETILQIGLPEQMEAQLETWAREQAIGVALDFGECSRLEKVEDRKWILELC